MPDRDPEDRGILGRQWVRDQIARAEAQAKGRRGPIPSDTVPLDQVPPRHPATTIGE